MSRPRRPQPGDPIRVRGDWGHDWACDLYEAWHPDLLAGHSSTPVRPGSIGVMLEERAAGPWTPAGARILLPDGRIGWVNAGLLEPLG